MRLRGSDLVVRALEDAGARFAFGIPGTHNIELYDALDRVTTEALYGAGGVLHSSTSAAYGGLQVTITDPRSNSFTRTANAWGDLVRLVDAAGGQTNYQYDAFGQLKQATDAYGTVVSQVSYNLRGMRTAITDVDLGAGGFTPNALGEIVSQTDAKSQTTSFEYDALGRLKKRTEAEGISNWTWGVSAAARNIGRLQAVNGPGYGETYTYDAYGRPLVRSISADATYQFDYAYNSLGQLDTLTWPTRWRFWS